MRIRFIRLIRCFYCPHPNNLCISVKSVGEYAAVNSVSSVCSVGECYYGGGLQRVQFLLCWCSSCSVGAFLARLVHLRQVHPLSVPPFASAVQSVSVRRPIGFRSPSDWIPFAVRSVSVRRPIRFRPPSVEKCWEIRCKNVVLNGNTIGDFAIFDVSVFRCFYYPHPNNLCISVKSVGEYSAVNSVSSAYSVGKNSAVNSVCFVKSAG